MSQRELIETSIVCAKDWVEIDDMYPDQILPGYERSNIMIIGPNTVFEERGLEAPVPAVEFMFGAMRIPPGGAAGLHTHEGNEFFFVLEGTCTFYWGDEEEEQAELQRWDTISFPAGVWRSIRNNGNEEVVLVGGVGGPDGSAATAHPRLLAAIQAAQQAATTES